MTYLGVFVNKNEHARQQTVNLALDLHTAGVHVLEGEVAFLKYRILVEHLAQLRVSSKMQGWEGELSLVPRKPGYTSTTSIRVTLSRPVPHGLPREGRGSTLSKCGMANDQPYTKPTKQCASGKFNPRRDKQYDSVCVAAPSAVVAQRLRVGSHSQRALNPRRLSIPAGSKYAACKVSGFNHHTFDRLWGQACQTLGMSTFWESNTEPGNQTPCVSRQALLQEPDRLFAAWRLAARYTGNANTLAGPSV